MQVGLPVVPVVVVQNEGAALRETNASGSSRRASLVVGGMRWMSS